MSCMIFSVASADQLQWHLFASILLLADNLFHRRCCFCPQEIFDSEPLLMDFICSKQIVTSQDYCRQGQRNISLVSVFTWIDAALAWTDLLEPPTLLRLCQHWFPSAHLYLHCCINSIQHRERVLLLNRSYWYLCAVLHDVLHFLMKKQK